MHLYFNKKTILLLFIAQVFITSFQAQNLPKFKDGDKICFIGNSITHGGTYHTFLQFYMATRFPNVKLEFYNAGISGDVADGMNKLSPEQAHEVFNGRKFLSFDENLSFYFYPVASCEEFFRLKSFQLLDVVSNLSIQYIVHSMV